MFVVLELLDSNTDAAITLKQLCTDAAEEIVTGAGDGKREFVLHKIPPDQAVELYKLCLNG